MRLAAYAGVGSQSFPKLVPIRESKIMADPTLHFTDLHGPGDGGRLEGIPSTGKFLLGICVPRAEQCLSHGKVHLASHHPFRPLRFYPQILTNLILLILCMVMVALQRLLYGPLRPIEIEQLYEKAWFAITETCLAMTIFRDEVGAWFLVMFVALLVGKVWGWIGEGRVEVLEQQPPANPGLFHARLSFSLLLSMIFDVSMLRYAVHTVLQMARPNMMVMFAFEFAVLTVASSSTTARYIISLTEAYITGKQMQRKIEERRAEIRAARGRRLGRDGEVEPAVPEVDADIDEMDIDVPGWEEKGQWVFYLDLVTDFLKLVVYLSFFFILLAFYGLPIHIMRDVFLTLRSFIKRITDFLRYRRATQDMNKRYPDASAEEIARGEVCIICREDMQPWAANNNAAAAPINRAPATGRPATARVDERSRPKKLPCGHILHFVCLRSWLERQQICPTCRRPVMTTDRVGATGTGNNPPLDGANDGANAGPQPPAPPGHGGVRLGQGADAPGANPQNRGRVFNIGPLRIGFGVGRDDVFQNLAQQLHGGAADPPGQPAQPPGARGPAANEGPQQIGFGFGFGRPQAQPAQQTTTIFAPSNLAAIQAQLQHLEHQINHEINNLRVTADQFSLVLALRAELQRLRQLQQGGIGHPRGGFSSSPTGPHHVRPSLAPGQVHQPHLSNPVMGADHPDLPPNMTLPPGWTLVPLTRLEPGQSRTQTGLYVPRNDGGNPGASVNHTHNQTSTPDLSDLSNPAGASSQAASSTSARISPHAAGLPDPPPTTSAGTARNTATACPPRQLHAGATEGELQGHSDHDADATPVPQWGVDRSQGAPASNELHRHSKAAEHAKEPLLGESSAASVIADAGSSKGKAKATSVEDFIDDTD